MEHIELKFKTSMQCGGCVSKVQPALDEVNDIVSWTIDTEHPDKILTVVSNGITEDQIIEIVKAKGFQIETLK